MQDQFVAYVGFFQNDPNCHEKSYKLVIKSSRVLVSFLSYLSLLEMYLRSLISDSYQLYILK